MWENCGPVAGIARQPDRVGGHRRPDAEERIPARASSASLRPLNNVSISAVELAPGTDGVAELTNANYQQRAPPGSAIGRRGCFVPPWELSHEGATMTPAASFCIGVAVLLVLVVSMGIYVRHMCGERRISVCGWHALPHENRTQSLSTPRPCCTLRARSAQIPLPGGREQRAEELLRALLGASTSNRAPLISGFGGGHPQHSFLVDPAQPSSI